jgi:hypothetical protein
MNINIGEIIEKTIKEKINKTLKENKNIEINYIATDSIGEVIEKLSILHIRIWMLEDSMQNVKNDSEIADIKKKLDICFKIKRPKLVEAINCLINDAIVNSKSLKEDSVKIYKGI